MEESNQTFRPQSRGPHQWWMITKNGKAAYMHYMAAGRASWAGQKGGGGMKVAGWKMRRVSGWVPMLTAPQSPFQHMGYPTLRSVDKLEDPSTLTQQHSLVTTMLHKLWMASMFRVSQWQVAALETTSGHLHQEGQVYTQELHSAPAAVRNTYDLHLWETSTFVKQAQALDKHRSHICLGTWRFHYQPQGLPMLKTDISITKIFWWAIRNKSHCHGNVHLKDDSKSHRSIPIAWLMVHNSICIHGGKYMWWWTSYTHIHRGQSVHDNIIGVIVHTSYSKWVS